jgi:hypothetical protein
MFEFGVGLYFVKNRGLIVGDKAKLPLTPSAKILKRLL